VYAVNLPALDDGDCAPVCSIFLRRRTLISFFSTTCTACIEEIPQLVSAWHSYDKRLTIVGVDEGNSARAVRMFSTKYSITYPLVMDVGGRTAVRYGIVALPTAILVSYGKVLAIHVGSLSRTLINHWLILGVDP